MRINRTLALAGLWILSMAIVAYAASHTQRLAYPKGVEPGMVLSGDDIGFRVHGPQQGDARTGTLVVRIAGNGWKRDRP